MWAVRDNVLRSKIKTIMVGVGVSIFCPPPWGTKNSHPPLQIISISKNQILEKGIDLSGILIGLRIQELLIYGDLKKVKINTKGTLILTGLYNGLTYLEFFIYGSQNSKKWAQEVIKGKHNSFDRFFSPSFVRHSLHINLITI